MAKGSNIGSIFVELSLDDKIYKQKLSETLTSTQTTTKGIETAWKALGSKSEAVFDAQRKAAENAYTLIKNYAQSTANDIVRAEEAKNAKIKQINEQQYGAHVSFTEKLKQNWAGVAASAYLAYKAFQIGKEMITASLQMERISMSMNAVADNATLAAREIQYIREESERLGLVFNDATVEYIKFAAAAKNTSIEGEQTRKIFTGMSEAITALKLSTMDANLIYMAMTQMISKGKVSMEELRRQMGERLPGAIRLAAEGMGMTTMELIKQIEAGKVMAYDLLPKLAERLHETYGQAALQAAQGGQAAINRFTNAVFETKAAMGDSLMPVLTDVLSLIKQIMPYITQFVGGIKILAIEASAWVNSMWLDDPAKVGMSYKEQLDMLQKIKEESQMAVAGGGTSSTKTPAELAIENAKIAAAKTKEVVKDVDAGLKSLRERIAQDTAKNSLTELQFIEYTAAQYLKKGLSQVEVEKWKTSEIEKINQKEADKILKIQQDAQEAIGKHQASATKEYEKLLTDEAEYGMTENERQINAIIKQEQGKLWAINVMLQEGTISWEQYEKARIGITTNASAAILDKRVEEANRIASINSKLIDGIIGMETTAFNLKMEQIEAEKNKYIKDGGDTVYAAKWAANEQIKAMIKLGKTGGSVSGGMSAAFQQLYLDQLTYGQAGYEMTMGFYSSTSSMFGSMLYDMKDGMSSFSDYWDSFTDSLWKVFSNMVSKMLSDWLYAMATMADSSSGLFGGGGFSLTSLIPGYGLFSGLSGLFSGAAAGGAAMGAEAFSAEAMASMVWLHGGGRVKDAPSPPRSISPEVFVNAPRAHTGLSPNERPVIAKTDEWVFRDKDIKGLIKMAGNSGDTYNITVKGSIFTVKSLVREIVPEIEKAKREGVH
jgi:tape measure domain-containing protein